MKCTEMKLYQISKKSCFFINRNGIILFFYVNDIVIAYRPDQRENVESYVKRYMKMFEIRDLNFMNFFLRIKIIRNRKKETVFIIQNLYMKKLVKKYEIDIINLKTFVASISVDLKAFDGEVDIIDIHQYRKMVESICYSIVGIKFDIVKTASKFSKFFINSGPNHMKVVMQCLCYFYVTRYLGIQYSKKTSNEKYLTAEVSIFINQIFEATADVFSLTTLTENSVRAIFFDYLMI